MSRGAWMMVLVTVMAVGPLLFVIASMVREIRKEKSARHSIWHDYGLGLSLTAMFFVSWIAQAIAEWQVYTDEQRAHGEATSGGDFYAQFAQSTLENWQSEFLQLFAFVVLTGLYIHKGSAESKDGTEKIEAAVRRIEEHLGTLPDAAPEKRGENWKLPDAPLEASR